VKKENVLITGTSSGFGFLTTLTLAKKGYHVIATMRDIKKKTSLLEEAKKNGVFDSIDIVSLDVTDEKQIQKVVEYVSTTYGSLDILINNAGYCTGGITETIPLSSFKEQFDTNFFGVIAVTKAFLPFMRKQRKGKIINIGSVSGSFGFPAMAPYVSSKFALRGYSESLRLELLPFNIFVSLVEPGSYQTNIWEKGLENVQLSVESDYQHLVNNVFKEATNAKENGNNPLEVAEKLAFICSVKKPAFYYAIGKETKRLVGLKKWIPWSLLEKIITYKLTRKKD